MSVLRLFRLRHVDLDAGRIDWPWPAHTNHRIYNWRFPR